MYREYPIRKFKPLEIDKSRGYDEDFVPWFGYVRDNHEEEIWELLLMLDSDSETGKTEVNGTKDRDGSK